VADQVDRLPQRLQLPDEPEAVLLHGRTPPARHGRAETRRGEPDGVVVVQDPTPAERVDERPPHRVGLRVSVHQDDGHDSTVGRDQARRVMSTVTSSADAVPPE
jgi:hypothetical protein